jgi:serine/threonine protein phosphatase PrpC
MEITEHLAIGDARLFVGQDMDKCALFDAGPGVAAVYSSRSPGKVSPNEDAAAFFPFGESDCVLAVADGLGGARAGHQASRLAMEAMRAALTRGIENGSEPREAVLNGFEDANGAVLELGIGAATTLAVVEVQGNIVRPYHVGDSLILVVGQRGKVKLQSVPHSPVGYGVESGLLDEKEAMYHEERHIVSNVIGSPDMRIEMGSTLELAARDTLLVASDGLWDNLHTEEIVDKVRKGGLRKAVRSVAKECGWRMVNGTEGTPSKPDDLTFILFRLYSPRRKVGR